MRRIPLPDELRDLPESKVSEVRLHLKLVTPMIGGGAVSGQPDEHWPIRASSIRGHLRWWWRATYGYKLPPEEMKQAEAQLWGWAPLKADDECLQGAIALEVEATKQGRVHRECNSTVSPNRCRHQPCLSSVPEGCKRIPGYVKDVLLQDREARSIVVTWATEFDLALRFNRTSGISKELARSALCALRAWVLFGGVGARTRRGAGTVCCVQDVYGIFKAASFGGEPAEPRVPCFGGARLALGEPVADPIEAWGRAANLWRAFRKGLAAEAGRDGPMRMYEMMRANTWPDWSESLSALDGSTPMASVPRAQYGLPFTLFRPQDKLKVSYRLKGSSRFGSWVILKALRTGQNEWKPSMLCLSAPPFRDEDLEIKNVSVRANFSTSLDKVSGPIGNLAMSLDSGPTHLDLAIAYAKASGWSEVRP